MRSNPAFERTDTIVAARAGAPIFSVSPGAAGAKAWRKEALAMANPTLEGTATSSAPRAGAQIFSVSRGAAGGVRSPLR